MITKKGIESISAFSDEVIVENENMIIKRLSPLVIVVASNKRYFEKWWRKMCKEPITSSATKYCKNPSYIDDHGLYIISTIDNDAVDIMNIICSYA